MEVYVIPVGHGRHALYSETVDADPEGEAGLPSGGWFRTLRDRFSAMIRAAEERSHMRAEDRQRPASWWGRFQERMIGLVAEKIVEQRLLWSLRRQTTVVAVHAPETPFDEAMRVIKTELQRDFERHRLWLFVYLVLLVASGLLALVPGPNLIAYYLAFRVVGHFLSLRGAVAGLRHVAWTSRVCPPLSELGELAEMDPHARHARVLDIGTRARLNHLARFFERVAVRHA
jgi:hypothetical protein